jgi:hypothetical protein
MFAAAVFVRETKTTTPPIVLDTSRPPQITCRRSATERHNPKNFDIKGNMKTRLSALALAAALTFGAAFAGNASAQTQPASPFNFFLGAGLTFGGDKLAEANYTNGDSSKLTAGALLQLNGGVRFQAGEKVTISGSVGYHVDNANASNGSLRFDRFPVELLAHYAVNEQWRLGGGVRFVSGPELSSSGVASGNNAKFDSATGAVIEAQYMINPKSAVAIRYVSEKYGIQGFTGKVDASHGGVFFNYYF